MKTTFWKHQKLNRMNNQSLTRKLLAKELLKKAEGSPEQLVEQLLEELARLKSELDQLNSYAPPHPVTDPTQKQEVIGVAIKNASFIMHRAFNTCQVPNAIHSKVKFPDGLYEMRFTRLSTSEYN